MTLPTFKKLCLLFLTANASTMAVNAQIQFGLKGGLNISEVLTSNGEIAYVSGYPQTTRFFPMAGVQAGLLASVQLSKKFSLQPELLFSAQGTTDRPSIMYSITATERYKFNWINIPVLLKYNLPQGFFVETGPQFGLLISAKINETVIGANGTTSYFVKDQFKTTEFGWALGTGYMFPYNLGFDVRYNLGLSNFSNVSASGMKNAPVLSGSIKNSIIQIGIFYLLGKSRTQAAPKENE
jgi:hypothetical protein